MSPLTNFEDLWFVSMLGTCFDHVITFIYEQLQISGQHQVQVDEHKMQGKWIVRQEKG